MSNSNEEAVAQVNAENTNIQEEGHKFKWSMNEASNYILPRVAVSSVVASTIGTSMTYYAGGGVMLSFYTYGLTAGLLGSSFFGGSYIIRNVREKDDTINYALSGSINGALLGSMKGFRGGMIYLAAGGLLGAGYKLISVWTFETSRRAWLSNRQYTIQNSKPRILHRANRPPPVDRNKSDGVIKATEGQDNKDKSILKPEPAK